jgi:hypothetical protein
MEKTGDYRESKRLAEKEANQLAEEQFLALRDELSQIRHYKADGYCCLSKGLCFVFVSFDLAPQRPCANPSAGRARKNFSV